MPPRQAPTASDVSPSKYWWNEADELRRALTMVAHVDSIQSLTAGRIRQFNSNVETYSSPERGAVGAYGGYRSGYRTGRTGGINKEQVALPVVWSVIQALASEIATNEPAPQFLTDGGDYKARREAELLTNLTRGVAYEADLQEEWSETFVDACVGGTGYLYFSQNWETNKIEIERVFPPEVITDPNDDIYKKPRSEYRVKYIDREELRDRFKITSGSEHATRLKGAKTLSGLLAVGNAAQTNMVKTYEAWHLPTSAKKGNGLHLFATSNDTLLSEPYTRKVFPIFEFRYDKRLMGFLGIGLSELIGSVQNHLNELLFTGQQSMSKHGVPHWLVHNNAFVSKQELNDLIGSVIYWSGSVEPKLQTFQSMPPDWMEMVQFDLQQIYQMSGVSLMAASAQKPSGLDSGEAIRAYVDTNSKRFQFLGKNVERYHQRIFGFIVELAREIVEKVGSYPVQVVRRGQQQESSLSVLDWKTAKDLQSNKWQIKCYPVSQLPSTPTGKLQYVKDLQEIGPEVISGEDAVELLQLPDTQHFLNLSLAGRRLAQRLVSEIIDDGKYRPPEPDCLPLGWAITHATQVLAKAESEDAPRERIAMLRQFISQLRDQQKAAMPPPAPTPGPIAPGMPPPGGAPAVLPPAPQAPLAPVAQPGQ